MAVISPQSDGTIQRPDLAMAVAEFDTVAHINKFVGSKVLPMQSVSEASGNYGVWPREFMSSRIDNISRAEGANYAETKFKLAQYNYECEEYGVGVPVDDRLRARLRYIHGNNEAVFDLAAAQRASYLVNLEAEIRIMDALEMGSAGQSAFPTGAAGTAWSTVASADPAEDIRAGIEAIGDATGDMPTSMLISGFAYRYLKQCESLLAELRSASLIAADKKAITPAILAAYFDLEEVIVSEARYNSAASEDTTADFDYICNTTQALLFKRAGVMSAGMPAGSAGLGRIMHWTRDGSRPGGVVEQYPDPQKRGKVIRVRHDVDEKIEDSKYAYIITGVTA